MAGGWEVVHPIFLQQVRCREALLSIAKSLCLSVASG